jgi:hypothetical protein
MSEEDMLEGLREVRAESCGVRGGGTRATGKAFLGMMGRSVPASVYTQNKPIDSQRERER